MKPTCQIQIPLQIPEHFLNRNILKFRICYAISLIQADIILTNKFISWPHELMSRRPIFLHKKDVITSIMYIIFFIIFGGLSNCRRLENIHYSYVIY
ncbi:hypothetical protein DP20_3033 [Shigella flexneri]|nr:hypothetical protein DP20_3033 [Shigella flexneri]